MKYRRARVDHDGNTQILCPGVEGIQTAVVGVEMLIGGVELQSPEAHFADQPLKFVCGTGDQGGVDVVREGHMGLGQLAEVKDLLSVSDKVSVTRTYAAEPVYKRSTESDREDFPNVANLFRDFVDSLPEGSDYDDPRIHSDPA